ncbi:hypothetical protein [Histidinibacterium lentulum]|uniref:hypothetical protein n=1 Tax=Histidinibacterium lentulum TaxID=2480588 RepID=UPI001622B34E|nr:hypothetical protein [Histidinibacterium lentulum]
MKFMIAPPFVTPRNGAFWTVLGTLMTPSNAFRMGWFMPWDKEREPYLSGHYAATKLSLSQAI